MYVAAKMIIAFLSAKYVVVIESSKMHHRTQYGIFKAYKNDTNSIRRGFYLPFVQ